MKERARPNPADILERGKTAHKTAVAERTAKTQRDLEQGVARHNELKGNFKNAQATIEEFDSAIQAAEEEYSCLPRG